MAPAGARPPTPRLDATISVLNAVIGDYLRRRGNGLQLELTLRHDDRPLPCEREAIARALPDATDRICLFVHGLATNERAWSFPGDPHRTYGASLRELGYTPFFLRYNSGLHVSENGALLAALVDALARCHPAGVREIVLVGHSMGGLVIRSACETARAEGQPWLDRVSHAFYLGSPHRGAPLEKAGNVVAWALRAVGVVHTTVLADVANLRSAGIKDLRFGSLLAADWQGRDPDALLEDTCSAVRLPRGVAHHLGVGGLGAHERHLVTRLVGDAMVRVASASAVDHRCEDEAGVDVQFFPRVGHAALAHHEDVDRWIAEKCAGERPREDR
jgi:triacylglycerol lipase